MSLVVLQAYQNEEGGRGEAVVQGAAWSHFQVDLRFKATWGGRVAVEESGEGRG